MFARLMGLKTVSPDALHRSLEGVVATVVDVNSRQSWLDARVPGAVHLDPAAFEAHDLPPGKTGTPLCRKAPDAARRAKRMGYTDVRVMSAGIRGWLDAGLPTESGQPVASR